MSTDKNKGGGAEKPIKEDLLHLVGWYWVRSGYTHGRRAERTVDTAMMSTLCVEVRTTMVEWKRDNLELDS